MNCRKCGAILPEGATFCQICGENNATPEVNQVNNVNTQVTQPPVNNNTSVAQPVGQPAVQPAQPVGQPAQPISPQEPPVQPKKSNTILMIVIIVLLGLIIVVGCFLIFGPKANNDGDNDTKVTETDKKDNKDEEKDKDDDKTADEEDKDNKDDEDEKTDDDKNVIADENQYYDYGQYRFKKLDNYTYSEELTLFVITSNKTNIPYYVIIHNTDYNKYAENKASIAEELSTSVGLSNIQYNEVTANGKKYLVYVADEAVIVIAKLAENVTVEFTIFDTGNAQSADQIYSELGAIIDSYEPKTTVASGGNENPEVSFKKDTYKGEVKLGDIFKLNN